METISRSEHSVRFKTFELDLLTRELHRNGQRVKLHGHPIDVLAILLERPGELVTREELRKRLWPENTFVDFEQILNNSIGKLRDALGDQAETPRFIETLPRLGYRFICALVNEESSASFHIAEGVPAPHTAEPIQETAVANTKERSWPRRRGWSLVLAAGLTAVLGLAVVFWHLRRPLPPPRITEYIKLTNDGERKILVGNDGSWLYMYLLNPLRIAQVAVNGGQTVPIKVSLPGHVLDDVSAANSRLLVTSYDGQKLSLWSVESSGGSVRFLADGSSQYAAWSPDGTSVVYSTAKETYVIRSDGSGRRLLVPAKAGSFNTHLSWSPDGHRIRFTRDYAIWEISSDGSNLHEVLPGWQPNCCGRWTPDGDYFVFLSGDLGKNIGGQIWAIDEHPGRLAHRSTEPIRLTSGPIHWGRPIPSPDGQKLFARGITPRGELDRISTQSKEPAPYLNGISAEFLSFSNDGKSLVYVSFPDGVLWRTNADGSQPVQLTNPPLHPKLPHWSPDGTQILFEDYLASGVEALFVVPSQGGEPKQLIPEDHRPQMDSNWSPDGKKIVYCSCGTASAGSWGSDQVRIFDLASRKMTTLAGGPPEPWSPRWSPDGRFIAVRAGGAPWRELWVLDLASQRWRSVVTQITEWPSWSRDSRHIYFLDALDNPGVFRVRVSDGSIERIADLHGFHHAGVGNSWMGLDPSDAPLLLRDVGIDEIYALTLER